MNIVPQERGRLRSKGEEQAARAFGKDITNVTRGASLANHLKKANTQMEKVSQPNKGFHNRDPIHSYHEDIFNFMCSFPQNKLDKETMSAQVTEVMRQILVDWLVDVQQNFKLKDQTLLLALTYLEQYQSGNPILKQEYQLVGITCLWMASKYEEIYPPRLKDFADVTANTYTRSQLKTTETKIISFLKFELNRVTPLTLLETLLLEESNAPGRSFSLAKYLIELGYLNGRIIRKYDTRIIVMGAVKLADNICKQETKTGFFNDFLGNPEFYACYKEFCLFLQVENKYKLTALKRKYYKQCNHGVSKITIKNQ